MFSVVDSSLQAMTDPKELDALYPGEAKRQREALRRKVNAGGHPKFSSVQTKSVSRLSHPLQGKQESFNTLIFYFGNMYRPPAWLGREDCCRTHRCRKDLTSELVVPRNTNIRSSTLRFELLKSFILDPTLDSITVESYFQQYGSRKKKPHTHTCFKCDIPCS